MTAVWGATPSQAMCFQVRDALRVGCIGISQQFFCNTMEPREMLKVVEDEMRNFCVLVEAPKTPFGRCTYYASKALRVTQY